MFKVAICGKANSGKNTVGKLIRKSLYNEFVGKRTISCDYIAFADPIKQMVRTMFPDLPEKFLTGPSNFRSEIVPGAFRNGVPLTVRQLLIDIGTNGRAYKESVWLDAFDAAFQKSVNKHKTLVIVTDVRFMNEFSHLKAKGFYNIRLLRDAHLKIDHASETNQDGIKDSEFDFVLDNNGSLDHLKERVKKIVEILKS